MSTGMGPSDHAAGLSAPSPRSRESLLAEIADAAADLERERYTANATRRAARWLRLRRGLDAAVMRKR